MNKTIYEYFTNKPENTCQLIPLDFARNLADLRVFRLGKVLKAIKILLILCFKLVVFRPSKIYFSIVPHGFVLIRDSLYLFAIKILRPKATPILHLHCPGLLEFRNKHHLDWFYRILFKRCTIIHLSKELLEQEIGTLMISKAKLIVLPNFIQVPQSDNQEAKEDEHILFLANLLPQKGYIQLIDAITLLKEKFPNIKLSLAGKTQSSLTEIKLHDKIANLGLANNIKLIGEVIGNSKQELYQRASIFVLPSKSEYFPLTILEAMSNKVAVITSGRKALQSYFSDNKHLIYLDELTPRHIAEKVEYLLLNYDKLTTIANEGYKRWLEIQDSSHKMLNSIMED